MRRTRTHRGVEYPVSPAHPVADLFPWMDEDALDELAADIQANGQDKPIAVCFDGRIADGRNRELACRVLGIEPKYKQLPAKTDDDRLVTAIISANLHRRHLTASQRAMIAANLETVRHGGNRKDQDANLHLENTRAENAEIFTVSPRTIASAAKVRDDAPELVEPVLSGELSVRAAEQASELPPEEREEIAEAENPREEIKKRLPAHFRPGNNADPDHPYADILAKASAFQAAVTRAINNPDDPRKLGEVLSYLSAIKFKIHWVLFSGGRMENGEHVPAKQPRFIGLRALRNVIRLAGKSARPLTPSRVLAAFKEANNTQDDGGEE